MDSLSSKKDIVQGLELLANNLSDEKSLSQDFDHFLQASKRLSGRRVKWYMKVLSHLGKLGKLVIRWMEASDRRVLGQAFDNLYSGIQGLNIMVFKDQSPVVGGESLALKTEADLYFRQIINNKLIGIYNATSRLQGQVDKVEQDQTQALSQLVGILEDVNEKRMREDIDELKKNAWKAPEEEEVVEPKQSEPSVTTINKTEENPKIDLSKVDSDVPAQPLTLEGGRQAAIEMLVQAQKDPEAVSCSFWSKNNPFSWFNTLSSSINELRSQKDEQKLKELIKKSHDHIRAIYGSGLQAIGLEKRPQILEHFNLVGDYLDQLNN